MLSPESPEHAKLCKMACWARAGQHPAHVGAAAALAMDTPREAFMSLWQHHSRPWRLGEELDPWIHALTLEDPAGRLPFESIVQWEELLALQAQMIKCDYTPEWLRYFAFHGSRPVEGGRVWKADPYAGRGFGPWRPDWIGPNWRHLRAPMLAVTGSEPDTWGPLPEDILAERLSHAPDVQRATVQGAGHFVQMERPAELAELLLGFLEAS